MQKNLFLVYLLLFFGINLKSTTFETQFNNITASALIWMEDSPHYSTMITAQWNPGSAEILDQAITIFRSSNCEDEIASYKNIGLVSNFIFEGESGNSYSYKIHTYFSKNHIEISNCSPAITIEIEPQRKTTYYVDARGGKDSNNGLSTTKPFKTIARVNKLSLKPGDKVLFKRGDLWREELIIKRSGTAKDYIYFGAYGKSGLSKPKIMGSNLVSGSETPTRDYCIRVENANYLKFENIVLKNAKRSGFRALKNGDYLSFIKVESLYNQMSGFEFDESDNVKFEYSKADYNRNISGGYGYLFKGGSSNVILSNSKASYNLRRGAQFDTGVEGYIKIIGGEYHHQYGNNQSDGISIDSNDGVQIEKTWTHDNGRVDNDSADGIQVSGTSKNALIRYCLTENNNNGGIVLETEGGSIYYNVSINNRHGVAVGKNENATMTIINNTLYNNEYALFIYQYSPLSTVKVHNNILYGSSAEKRALYFEKGLDSSKVIMDNNAFWGDNNEYLIEWKGTLYTRNNFVNFVKNTQTNLNYVLGDPLFVDRQNKIFHLQNNSPCIDKGIDSAYTEDFDGHSISGKPDLGAFEF